LGDLFDRAQEREQQLRDEALKRQRDQMPKGESAENCEDCGTKIPQRRRRAIPGVGTCVDCQEDRERRRR